MLGRRKLFLKQTTVSPQVSHFTLTSILKHNNENTAL